MAKKKKPKEYLETVGGKVPPAIKRGVERIAAERRWTVSQYVRYALESQYARDAQAPAAGS